MRKSHAEPWHVRTLPDFSVTDERATIVPFTCDEIVNAAAKFINSGVSLQNRQTMKDIRLVGDANHDERGGF